mgnify:FL=1
MVFIVRETFRLGRLYEAGHQLTEREQSSLRCDLRRLMRRGRLARVEATPVVPAQGTPPPRGGAGPLPVARKAKPAKPAKKASLEAATAA